MLWKWPLTIFLLLSLLVCDAGRDVSGQRPVPRSLFPLIPFDQYRLPNGLRVLLAPNKSAATISLCVTYNVGSRDEQPGQAGWAHLMEHMMFQGSAHVGRGEHRRLVQEVGGEFQAATGYDHTEYYEELPANQRPLALFLEADRMAALDLTQANLDNQRAVVLSEKAQRASHQSDDVAQAALFNLSYIRFAYKHQSIGEKADLDAATVSSLRAFSHRYYAPNNAVLALTGHFEEPTAKAEIARDFGPIPAHPAPPPAELSEPPPPGECRKALSDDFSRLQRCVIGYRIPPAVSPDYQALSLLSDILGRGRTARLYRTLVDPKQAIYVSAETKRRRGPSLFVVTAELPAESAFPPVLKAINTEMTRIQTQGVTSAELQKAKNWAKMDFWYRLRGTAGKARFLANETTDTGDANRVNTLLARLNAQTPADVQRAARRYLVRPNRVILTVSPTVY